MASNVTRMPRQQMAPQQRAMPQQMAMPQQQMLAPGTQQGNWFWDGSNWSCGCDGSGGNFPFCPPPGFPPAGCPPWFSGVNSPPWYPGANAGVSFGQQAPLNPVRGHFWWNGSGLYMFDGAAWVLVGGSSTPNTVTEPVFSITSPGITGLPVNVWQPAPITAVPTLDTQGAWNPATHQFKPNRGGIYFFETAFDAPIAVPGFYWQMITRNDNGVASGTMNQPVIAINGAGYNSGTGTEETWATVGGMALMNGVTDFVRIWFSSSAGIFAGSPTATPTLVAWLLPS